VAALDGALGNVAARESYTPKQTFFYGRNPETAYVFLHLQGEFVDVALKPEANAAYLADKAAKRTAEQLAATACLHTEKQRNRKAAGRLTDGQFSPIDAFNDAHDVRSILTAHGYRAKGSKYVAPSSTSGMAGVVILQGQDGRERAFSHHTNDPIADGMAHDAFDLFCILDHGGDEWSAIQAAAKLLITSSGETIHSHNRNIYRNDRTNSKAQAALNRIKGIAA
jgi:putative DNA primase/helicase